MADKKISQLTSATVPLAGTEVLPIVQGGSTVKVTVSDLTSGRSFSSAGASLDGAVTINDSGVDVDFRVEGDTDANLLFVDASTDRIGIGTNAPQQKAHVAGNLRFSGAQVGTKIENQNTTISVTTSAVTILDEAGAHGRVAIVNGADGGNRFCDLVFCSTAASPTVIASFTAFGTPAARTYTRSGGALQLAMASGTYVVNALALGY